MIVTGEVIMQRVLGMALTIFIAAAVANSDVVSFKNGDRLTGDWVRVAGHYVIFKSDNLGTLTISLKKVESLSTSKPAVALLEGGGMVKGTVYLLPTGSWVISMNRGIRTLPAKNVVAILPVNTFEKLGGERRNRPWLNWRGSTSVGYSLERGDTTAGTISAVVNAVRMQPNLPGVETRWRTNYNLNMLLASTRAESTGAQISSNTFTSGVRQDYLFTPHDFLYVQTQFDHIQPQALNLRQSYGGGFGKDMHRTKTLAFSVLGGLTYVDETFQGAPRRRNLEGFGGERLEVAFTKRLNLIDSLNLYPSITAAGLFRGDSTTTLSFGLNTWLSVNASVIDFYLGQPPAGSRKNNLSITTGLGVNF